MLSSQIFQVFDNDHMLYFTKYRVLCITWLKKIQTILPGRNSCPKHITEEELKRKKTNHSYILNTTNTSKFNLHRQILITGAQGIQEHFLKVQRLESVNQLLLNCIYIKDITYFNIKQTIS